MYLKFSRLTLARFHSRCTRLWRNWSTWFGGGGGVFVLEGVGEGALGLGAGGGGGDGVFVLEGVGAGALGFGAGEGALGLGAGLTSGSRGALMTVGSFG